MKMYTIIGGVNGVGKSSFTGVLKSRTTDLGIIIDIDKLTVQAGGDSLAGGRAAVRTMDGCILGGVSFTQETTLSGHQVRKTVRRVKELGYYVRLYYIGLDTAGESEKRITNRVALGGHDVPREMVRRRFQKRWDDLRAVLPYCDEAIFYDNRNGFIEVASYRNGELILEGEYRPGWIKELSRCLR